MAALAGSRQPSAFAVFQHRSFALLWTGQLISTMGNALTALTASILVYRLTGSALGVGLMMIATALPSLLVGLIAGVYVDRVDRKGLMIAADLIRAVLVGLIPLLWPAGLAWLFGLIVLSGAVGQFYDPAHASVLPEVAADEELAAANAFMQISDFGSMAVGFAAAGLITSRLPIAWAFYLDAATFVVSATCIALTRITPLASSERTTVGTVLHNLRAGVTYLVGTPILRSLFLVGIPAFAGVGLLNALLLPFVVRTLHATTFQYGLIEGLSSAGFVAGSLVMARLSNRLHEGQWIALSYLGVGVACAIMAFASSVPLAILIYAVAGFVNAPNYVGRSLVIQRHTQRELRGRVTSAFLVTRNVLYVVGMAAAGAADLYGGRAIYLAGALVIVGAGLLVVVLPGLGRPAAEWRKAVALVRAARTAPTLGPGRPATEADVDVLARLRPELAGMGADARRTFAAQTCVREAPAGTVIVRQGDSSDAAYFILAGRAVVGRDEEAATHSLAVLQDGDFFGEIAALTGVRRTANVVAEQPTTVLQVPAATVRWLMNAPQVRQLFVSTMSERLAQLHIADLPRFAGLDQGLLRELRTPDAHPTPEADVRST